MATVSQAATSGSIQLEIRAAKKGRRFDAAARRPLIAAKRGDKKNLKAAILYIRGLRREQE
jgi:hypothetical protein